MATVERNPWTGRSVPVKGSPPAQRMHRISTVRRQQGLSLRSASRQLGADLKTVRGQEAEDADIRLSDLYAWQAVLGVPISELLNEPSTPLSRPVMERARLVRIMKTVKAIIETSSSPRVTRLAQTLIQQLVEVMPELADVGPWHSVGQRRSLDEYGRAAERLLSEDSLLRQDLF